MKRSSFALLACGALVVPFSSCSPGKSTVLLYPVSVTRAAAVSAGTEHAVPLADNTVDDGMLRIDVEANQGGMILTLANRGTAPRTVLWDDATIARADASERRFAVSPDAKVFRSDEGELKFMMLSGALTHQELPAGATARAFARPQLRFPRPLKRCDDVLGASFLLRVPVAAGEAVTTYALELRTEWFQSLGLRELEGTTRCGPEAVAIAR